MASEPSLLDDEQPALIPVEETPAPEPEPEPEVEGWGHETVEFEGDHLEVRKPTQQALAAFSLATSKYVSPQTRNDMTGMFILRHLSPESYERVFSRLMDPDDEDYNLNTIGALMRAIVELRNDATATPPAS